MVVCGTVTATNNSIERVSISTDGNESNYNCEEPSISVYGRYIVFSSYADNLVSDDNNGYNDIFVHDNTLNITERVSISSTGIESDGNSYKPAISDDGRFVVFVSHATNLVEIDTNDVSDIFVYDRLLKQIERVNLAVNGEQANSYSSEPSISGDGNYVVFTSWASNLVENDTNEWGDVFVCNRITGTLERVSISSSGDEQVMPPNSIIHVDYEPSISGDGRFIAFTSYAENLVDGDNNNCQDIFLYDRILKITKRISVSIDGQEATGTSENPAISSNGLYIVFTSNAGNLVENDDNPWNDIFVHDIETGFTEKVSIFTSEETISRNPSISGDGRFITFETTKGGQTRVSNSNEKIFSSFADVTNYYNIFIYDQTFKTINCITKSYMLDEANSASYTSYISADGSSVVFTSYATNLIPEDSNYCADIFVYSQYISSSITGTIISRIVKSGDEITVMVNTLDSSNISATILNEVYYLNKGSDGIWYLSYIVPNIPDGTYDVILTSTNGGGHEEQITLNFIVDNTLPTISGYVTPDTAKKWDLISINAMTSIDTVTVTASILGEIFNLSQLSENSWNLDYAIPDIEDGVYLILLTAIDNAGNQNTFSLSFAVDNGPPTVSGYINPEKVKTFDKINITAISDKDTSSITALIFNQTYDLTKQDDETWNFQYTVLYVSNGNYIILLTALDSAGNQSTFPINFTVLNPIDTISPIISGIITHTNLLNGVFVERPSINIHAFVDSDVVNATATIMDNNYSLTRQEDGSWSTSSYSWLGKGIYTALLTAQDWSGNIGTTTIIFNVENTIPTITSTLSPEKLKSGDSLILNVNISPDARTVYASTPTGFIDLEKQTNGSWALHYMVPQLEDGDHTIWIKILYGTGWLNPDSRTIISADGSTNFTVDNTPPYISGSATPNPLRSGDTLKIEASGSTGSYFKPDDTANITATILGRTYNMTKISSWSDWWKGTSGSDWSSDYVVPALSDGIYTIYFTATDLLSNQRTSSINFTVDNTPPVITGTINPNTLKFIDFGSERILKITAQSSSDTKNIYAYFDGSFSYHPLDLYTWRGSPIFVNNPSSQNLNCLNGYWIYGFGAPSIITIGTHYIKLVATDYAGNEGIFYLSLIVTDFSGLTKPPNEWSGIGIGNGSNGGSSSDTGSSGNNGGNLMEAHLKVQEDPMVQQVKMNLRHLQIILGY